MVLLSLNMSIILFSVNCTTQSQLLLALKDNAFENILEKENVGF